MSLPMPAPCAQTRETKRASRNLCSIKRFLSSVFSRETGHIEKVEMCKYYHYVWACSCEELVFGKHCGEGARMQRECIRKEKREVWVRVHVGEWCVGCGG